MVLHNHHYVDDDHLDHVDDDHNDDVDDDHYDHVDDDHHDDDDERRCLVSLSYEIRSYSAIYIVSSLEVIRFSQSGDS